jgi:hypothetical protein
MRLDADQIDLLIVGNGRNFLSYKFGHRQQSNRFLDFRPSLSF